MGITKVKLQISNPFHHTKSENGEFLVDSGTHYTVIPADLVVKLGLKKSYEQEFSLADGTTVKRNIGGALINFQGRELPVPVVLGEKDDSPLLGVTTLESFGLIIDPFKRKLYSSKLMLG